jgi:hypothetical protein
MSLESSVSLWDSLAFWLTVAAAVLAFIGGLSSIAYRRLNRQLESTKALAEQREKDANSKAIADANARAAEANQRAAALNLEIVRLKTPRRLSPEQQQRMAATLKRFAGQKFSLTVGQEPEQLNLLADVKATLLSSGWVQVPPTGFGDIMIGDAALGFGTGVIGRFAPATNANIREIAQTLADALNAEDIASKPEPDARVFDH